MVAEEGAGVGVILGRSWWWLGQCCDGLGGRHTTLVSRLPFCEGQLRGAHQLRANPAIRLDGHRRSILDVTQGMT